VSDPREQSYYEIALTNRQVMTIFVVLLVCVLAAFLGGVWVGRGDGVVVTTTEPEEIDSGVQPGEPPLEELDFFSETGSASTAEPTTGTAAAEDREQPEVAVAESPQPVILEEIGPSAARAQPPAAEPAAADPEPAATESASAASAVSIPPTPTPSAIVAPPIGGALVIQVFSSTDQQQARRTLERLQSGGYPAVMSTGDVDGRPMYRVRVGPYNDRAEAQTVADRIRRAYKLDTWITR
jgi:cell division septation protein DedD